jgi:hypothetical protein
MKTALSALALLVSVTPSAFAWETVVDCDQGAFVIDRQTTAYGKFEYQAVFRFGVIEHLYAGNLILDSDVNDYGEVITYLGASDKVLHYGLMQNGIAFLFQDNNVGDAFVLGFSSSGRGTPLTTDYTFQKCDFKFGPVGRQ